MRVRLPRVRVRLWWLMVAVAVAGGASGGVVLWSRASQYRALAQAHAASLNSYEVSLFRSSISPPGPDQPARYRVKPDGPDMTEYQIRAWAAYHKELEEKYDRAARYPWLPVEPDGPMPAFAPN